MSIKSSQNPELETNKFVVPNLTAIVGDRDIKLGAGTYGAVYRTTEGYAIKKMNENELDQSTVREISIMNYLNHPNILQAVAVQLSPPEVAMPIAKSSLNLRRGGKLDEGLYKLLENINNRKYIFYQIFRGLAYCHSKHIWHLDIKPDNVLLFQDNLVKLADFGLAVPYARPANRRTNVVTSWWRAPELFMNDVRYTQGVDIWAVGVMLLEYATDNYGFFNTPFEQGQLAKMFEFVGGKPTNKEWPEVEDLPDYPMWEHTGYTLTSKEGSTNWTHNSGNKYLFLFEKPDRLIDFETVLSPEEYQLIQDTVTWPNKRITAEQALASTYFDTVRNQIEQKIPALPIVNKPCGETMLQDQRQIMLTKEVSVNLAKIFSKGQEVEISYQTLLYATHLYYLYPTTPEAALKIAADVHDDYLDISDFAEPRDETALERQIMQLIEDSDFQLIMPTCNDFIYYYLCDTKHNDTDSLNRASFYAFVLLLNSHFATQYTSAQLAEIAITALGWESNCFPASSLYSDEIKEYYATVRLPTELDNIFAEMYTGPRKSLSPSEKLQQQLSQLGYDRSLLPVLLEKSWYSLENIIPSNLSIKEAECLKQGRPKNWCIAAPLQKAVSLNLLELIQAVGIDKSDADKTALMYAAILGDRHFVQTLLNSGARIDIVDFFGSNVLTYAPKEVVMDVLLDHFSANNINHQNDEGQTALHMLVDGGETGAITLLVNAGADLNIQDNEGYTPLMNASSYENGRELLIGGADPNLENEYGQTALMKAAQNGLTELITLLIQNTEPSLLYQKDQLGKTAWDYGQEALQKSTEPINQSRLSLALSPLKAAH
jgi:serine/threonine protein kinase/ankyrin repeat protein